MSHEVQAYGQAPYPPQSQAPPGYGPPQSHASAPMVPQYAVSQPGQYALLIHPNSQILVFIRCLFFAMVLSNGHGHSPLERRALSQGFSS